MRKKSRIKGALILMMGVLVAMCMSGMAAFADDVPESSGNALKSASTATAKGEGEWYLTGYCGPNDNQEALKWTLEYYSGYVYLEGSGDMGFSPWQDAWRDEVIKKAQISGGVTSLCDDAFRDCVNLEYVGFTLFGVYDERYLKKIGKRAFKNCTSLNNYHVNNIIGGKYLEEIGEDAFLNCTGLTHLSVQNSVKKIGQFAFGGCTGLIGATLGTGIEQIGVNAFTGCTSLSEINVAGGNQYFSSDDGVLFDKNKTTLITCPAAKENCTIPNTVTHINAYAFYGCKNLKHLTIPASVTSIGQLAFSGCSSLETITFLGNAPTFHSNAFGGQTVTAVFPGGNESWTDAVLKGYSGNITWQPDPVNLSECDVSIANSSAYTYTGKPIEPAVTVQYNGRALNRGADYIVSYDDNVNAGTVTVTIAGNYRYCGTRTETFSIAPAQVTVPSGQTLTYNGTVQQGVADSDCYTATGNTAEDAGEYTATLSVNKNYTWSDGSTTNKEVTWTIDPALVDAPFGQTLTYNGKKQTGVAAGTGYDISGNAATDAGMYTATLALQSKTNYKWSDGTTDDVTVGWKINKAANPLTMKAKTAKVKFAKLKKKAQTLAVSKVITFTKKGQGAMVYTVSSVKKGGKSFKGKITINKTTGKVTVKKGLKKGAYKVKAQVKAAGSKNYEPSAVKEVTFTVKVK